MSLRIDMTFCQRIDAPSHFMLVFAIKPSEENGLHGLERTVVPAKLVIQKNIDKMSQCFKLCATGCFLTDV